jgi:hypothetical protein
MTALDIIRKAEHEIVNAVATYMLCERNIHNEKCNQATHRIVEAIRLAVSEIMELEIEDRR